jgi:CubicO group peptidase (beta-lactamase class C family)
LVALATVDSIRAEQALERAILEEAAQPSPGLVVGVVGVDGLLASRAWGLASLEHRVPVSASTVFYLASVSKQFTAACVLLAEDSGHLSRADRLSEHVHELPAWADAVTIGHLISHQAGLPEYGDLLAAVGLSPDAPLSDEMIMGLLAEQSGLVYPPGARCEYSNTAFWLLGVVVARATGATLRAFGEAHLFEPLAMRATWYRDDRWEVIPNLASGYLPLERAGYRHWRTCFDRVGDGGLVSSLSDLALWESAVLFEGSPWAAMAGRLAEPRPLLDGTISDWRAGVLAGSHAGHEVVMAGGTGFGYRAFSVRDYVEGVSVIALSNLGSADVRSPAFSALDQLLQVG